MLECIESYSELPEQLRCYQILENFKYNNKFIFICNHKDKKFFIKQCIENSDSQNELKFINKLNKFNNNYIVKCNSSVIDNHYINLVMDYYPINLYEYTKIYFPINIDIILRIVKQLEDVIEFLHKLNICHGDIKLENIMYQDNCIKLIDFETTSVYDSNNIKISGKKGTLFYCAPEILRGESYNPFKSELWAFGVCVYVMSELKYPYYLISNSKSNSVILEKEIEFKKTDNKVLPIIKCLMNKNPLLRKI